MRIVALLLDAAVTLVTRLPVERPVPAMAWALIGAITGAGLALAGAEVAAPTLADPPPCAAPDGPPAPAPGAAP